MPSFTRNGVHSQGCSFKSLYLNPLNDLRDYEDGGSGELNLHLCSSSGNGLYGQGWSSNRGKKPMEEGGGRASSSWNTKNGLSHRRKGFFSNSCASLVDIKENRNLWFETNANLNDSMCVWDDSNAVTAPASAWSTLSNRSLIYRQLPEDIGRCSCYIVQEQPDKHGGFFLYTLYTNSISLGVQWKDSKKLVAIATFFPTIATLTGSFRRMKAFVPKSRSKHAKNSLQVRNSRGLSRNWEENKSKVHQLFSKTPHYNKSSKQHELDFRERSRTDISIQASVKNFQLTMKEDGGGQTVLLFGKLGKSKYLMDYRYPLTGYQAFAICLASIDSKLCYCI
ncbi:tubby-like protein 8 isoform X3 [Nymphaea colorata]|uniref:tubby-like protein 8 isoform X3 n=1 Tax=Nymphaea colorata TaxID=210225 RepID=UPI00214EB556|nr:tubby-like protein 8 isoform X3 [Nymphaea colorata]